MTHYPALFRRAAAFILAGAIPFAANSSFAAPAEKQAASKTAATPIPKDPEEFEFRNRRIVRLTGSIDQETATEVIRKLEYLDALDTGEIELRINSYGGQVSAGLAIYDTIRSLKNPVKTVCEGVAQSMGAYLLVAGAEGRREARPNCRIMIHEPSSDPGRMSATDQRINIADTEFLRQRLIDMFTLHTGISPDQADRLLERDTYLTPEQAMDFGVIDRITPYVQPAPHVTPKNVPMDMHRRQTAQSSPR